MALLGLLDREPSHGYDLKRDYDAYFGRGRPLPFGQVYATLARLARDGKAVAGDAEAGAGPDRKRYTITETGKYEVEAWLGEPIPAEPYLQTDLFVKVVLSLMLGRPAEDYLDVQRAAHLRRMRELTEPQTAGQPRRRAPRRPRALSPGGRSALDRPHRGAARRTRRGGGVVNGTNSSPAAQSGRAIIEARDLVISFGETPALRGADLSVQRGEVLAVMGPSGSGKSTLLYCLAGILVPDSGEVSFDGQRLDTMREEQRSRLRRDRFGFVFQSGQLVPELTAEENVALPLLLGGTRRKEALRGARAWFERLELDGLERHRAGEMSGGQAQRVALARGLVAHPDVLFADEPTGSLDSLTGELVMGLMTGAAREEGTTVVLVTHEPRVAAYADREVIVRDGRVTTTATVAR